jgi:hypothetical protein
MVFLTAFLAPGNGDCPHELMVTKKACVEGSVDCDTCLDLLRSHMTGEFGTVRSMNALVAQGGLRMVVMSPLQPSKAGSVCVPDCAAKGTEAKCKEGSACAKRSMQDGDWAILARQPCMWSGGIQPVTIRVTSAISNDEGAWNVNSSMRLPLSACQPFAADHDGDEMTLFVVSKPKSMKECESFKCVFSWSPLSS